MNVSCPLIFFGTDTYFVTGDRSMSSSLSASQLHTVNMRDPLNRVLGKRCFSCMKKCINYYLLNERSGIKKLQFPHCLLFGPLDPIVWDRILRKQWLRPMNTHKPHEGAHLLLPWCSPQPTCSCSSRPSWAPRWRGLRLSLCRASLRSALSAWSREAVGASCNSCRSQWWVMSREDREHLGERCLLRLR